MAKQSPTSRTKKMLQNLGYTVAITERWNQWAKIRQDLFGFIDLIAIRKNEIVGVQTTTMANKGARVDKILGLPEAKYWLESGAKIQVICWRKLKAGWTPDLHEVLISDFAQEAKK